MAAENHRIRCSQKLLFFILSILWLVASNHCIVEDFLALSCNSTPLSAPDSSDHNDHSHGQPCSLGALSLKSGVALSCPSIEFEQVAVGSLALAGLVVTNSGKILPPVFGWEYRPAPGRDTKTLIQSPNAPPLNTSPLSV